MTSDEQPNLGLATTAQLLDELRARIEVDYYLGGGGLGYSTVGGRPPLPAAGTGAHTVWVEAEDDGPDPDGGW